MKSALGCLDAAIGISRGGQTTKVHVITDVVGRPAVIHLTPGNAAEIKTAPELIARVPGRMRRLLADRGYDADHLRRKLGSTGSIPGIPGRRTRNRPIRHDGERYKEEDRGGVLPLEGFPPRGNPRSLASGLESVPELMRGGPIA